MKNDESNLEDSSLWNPYIINDDYARSRFRKQQGKTKTVVHTRILRRLIFWF